MNSLKRSRPKVRAYDDLDLELGLTRNVKVRRVLDARQVNELNEEAYILHLPHEILERILELVDFPSWVNNPEVHAPSLNETKREIGRYCLVSHAFNSVLQRQMFQMLDIPPDVRSIKRILEALEEHPYLHNFVQSVKIRVQCSSYGPHKSVLHFFRRLHSCKRLREVDITFEPKPGTRVIGLPICPFSWALRSVESARISFGTINSSIFIMFLQWFSNLKQLHLNGADFSKVRRIAKEDKNITFPSVRKLMIEYCSLSDIAIEIFTGAFPNVEEFHAEGISPETSLLLRQFHARYPARLKSVTLLDTCAFEDRRSQVFLSSSLWNSLTHIRVKQCKAVFEIIRDILEQPRRRCKIRTLHIEDDFRLYNASELDGRPEALVDTVNRLEAYLCASDADDKTRPPEPEYDEHGVPLPPLHVNILLTDGNDPTREDEYHIARVARRHYFNDSDRRNDLILLQIFRNSTAGSDQSGVTYRKVTRERIVEVGRNTGRW
ncbi:uncharacterized protein V1510DRAFT_402855 [Dipodascopsis tothii]|uniref:uncharacterized protein n=1 Tax=Dipodascopsis tothii TaxID=44089 RepID=UPI0034D00233